MLLEHLIHSCRAGVCFRHKKDPFKSDGSKPLPYSIVEVLALAKDIIRFQHKGTNICVRRYWNKTQLLLDDVVVDTWKGVIEIAYNLHGMIGNDKIDISITPAMIGEHVHLSINGVIVDKAWKA